MKAAPERPFSPVFCLHGPTEESGEGLLQTRTSTSTWQGET